MATKPTYLWVCSACGHIQDTNADLCDGCGGYQTLQKTKRETAEKTSKKKATVTFSSLDSKEPPLECFSSGFDAFDAVIGGGFVEGGVMLITGDTGIGKTTILLQILAATARKKKTCLYISGEQSESDLRTYAKRFGIHKTKGLKIAHATNTENIISALTEWVKEKKLHLIVIDSVQTLWTRRHHGDAGSPTQMKYSSTALKAFAKEHKVALIMVGHIVKDGRAAGPKTIQHLVDILLHMEGEPFEEDGVESVLRTLHCTKNRYGPTPRTTYFAMTDKGLEECDPPDSDET